MEKSKLKKLLKAKWYWFLGSGLFLIAGLIVMLIGFRMSGWSIAQWFASGYGTTACILIGIGIAIIVVMLVYKRIAHLGGYHYDNREY